MSTQTDPPRLLAEMAETASKEASPNLLRDALAAAQLELPTPDRLATLQGKIALATGAGAAVGAGATVAKSALWLKVALAAAGTTAIAILAVAVAPKHDAPLPSIVQSAPTISPPVATAAKEDASLVASSALPVATHVPTAAIAPPPSAKAPSSDLTEETRLLTEAQRALTSNPAEALRLCDQHRKTFAAGVLSQERDAVVVEALMKLGRRAEAKRAAASFAHNYPGSSHQRRISDLVGDSAD